MDKTFKGFYQRFGLQTYPFDVYTSENERDKLEKLFIEPLEYSLIKDTFLSEKTLVVLGNRGTGKTAILYDLIRKVPENENIIVSIEDYSELREKPELIEYYQLIIEKVVEKMFEQLIYEDKRIKKLPKEDKIFLSYLLQEYTTSITKEVLAAKIQMIQISRVKRCIKGVANILRGLSNYGASALTNLVNATITKHFSMLPLVDPEEVKSIFPEFNIGVDVNFNKVDASYKLIDKICTTSKRLGYKKVIVFLDKIDEDNRLANDAETIGQFVKPLMTDNKLLLNNNIQLIVSTWTVPFNMIKAEVRTQKHAFRTLNWKKEDLFNALNKRIQVFGKNENLNYNILFEKDVISDDIDGILELANSNPRDLWHLLNQIFLAQYEINFIKDNFSKNKLSKESIEIGMQNFVKEFNFYEYYPRKNNAKSSSMDIYSYIKHLLKLEEVRFTKNRLSERAGTGGSTQNYVTGMERMGLISKTDEKISSGVVYRIDDPKVTFAIENRIDISRD